MSAFMHGNRHISAIIRTVYSGLEASRDDPTQYNLPANPRRLFAMLRLANAKSIAHRYGHHGETVQGNVLGCGTFDENAPILNRADCYQAIRSYSYQCDEHPGWNGSGARKAVSYLIDALQTVEGGAVALPGGAWTVD